MGGIQMGWYYNLKISSKLIVDFAAKTPQKHLQIDIRRRKSFHNNES